MTLGDLRVSSAERDSFGRKRCRKCDSWQDESQFVKYSRTSDGLGLYCRLCRAFQNRVWYTGDRKSASPERKQLLRDISTVKQRHRMARLKAAVYAKLGSKCCKCGFGDMRALQIDHVYGDGKAERDSKGRRGVVSNTLYKRVLQDADGRYQILCANCNWIKRHENKEAPQRRAVTLKSL